MPQRSMATIVNRIVKGATVKVPTRVSVPAYVLEKASVFGAQPAVIGPGGAVWTHGELPHRVGSACAGLKDLGVKAGTVVNLHMCV